MLSKDNTTSPYFIRPAVDDKNDDTGLGLGVRTQTGVLHHKLLRQRRQGIQYFNPQLQLPNMSI